MKELIIAGILFFIAIVAFVLSVRSFCEKGFLLNNAYLYASKEERESMDKRPYYRQTAVVFLLISIVFLLNGFSIVLLNEWISYMAIAIIFIVIIYAIVSSVLIERKNNEKTN